MAENNKKRTGSFRKLFPSLFFSSKSKEKNNDSQGNPRNVAVSSKCNQYQNPRSIRSDKNNQISDDNERIYENLSSHALHSDNETHSNDISSHNSSSSTLVSGSVKNNSFGMDETSEAKSIGYTNFAARPQVPRKPYESGPQSSTYSKNVSGTPMYPDVYYHSLEKLSDKISPLDEIEIYRASQVQDNPASVGAEIKRVSTKFLISPKKEAEVRTIQPTRARSLSFDNQKENVNENKPSTRANIKQENIKKPYNYSAPTSPIPLNHKIPNMPKTISPYEHVRKAIMETEEKRNSLSRSSIRNMSPSPKPEYNQKHVANSSVEISKQEAIEKEKTRQKVEAFYWQKLKELKQKEDKYLIRQSLNSSLRSPMIPKTNSNSSTPKSLSFVSEPRSSSLPRGNDIKSYMNQPIYTSTPFMRGAPERRTDTFINSRTSHNSPEIIYRHPEKLFIKASPVLQQQKMRIYQHRSATLENRNMGQTKRVSFEAQYAGTGSDYDGKVFDYEIGNKPAECSFNLVSDSDLQSRVPPRPPIRTTSVRSVDKNIKLCNNKRIAHLVRAGNSLYSESESGSEAGEIQKILQSNTDKDYVTKINLRLDNHRTTRKLFKYKLYINVLIN